MKLEANTKPYAYLPLGTIILSHFQTAEVDPLHKDY